ncbi:MAG: hypothetical protein BWY66_00018 [bacterium ADurb.Bin374]|nr:MAG: hypothetical protein BWY66_00018 [bacterium ADurb.Bin374]
MRKVKKLAEIAGSGGQIQTDTLSAQPNPSALCECVGRRCVTGRCGCRTGLDGIVWSVVIETHDRSRPFQKRALQIVSDGVLRTILALVGILEMQGEFGGDRWKSASACDFLSDRQRSLESAIFTSGFDRQPPVERGRILPEGGIRLGLNQIVNPGFYLERGCRIRFFCELIQLQAPTFRKERIQGNCRGKG